MSTDKEIRDMTDQEMDLLVEEGYKFYGEYGRDILAMRCKCERDMRNNTPFAQSVRKAVKRYMDSKR